MGILERHGWEKEVEICGKEGKESWAKVLNRCDGPFLLNEHGDLYFLLYKNIVHIILLN